VPNTSLNFKGNGLELEIGVFLVKIIRLNWLRKFWRIIENF